MKLLMGFIVLLVALVAVTGCTQTASPSAPATTVPTAMPTPLPTTVVANMTTMVPTANATAVPVNTTEEATPAMPTPTPATMVTTIQLTSAGFTPQTDIVLPGTGVSFLNNDNVTHTIIGMGNSTGTFNSGALIPGTAFQYTFSKSTGVLYYGLADNPTVTGTIIIQAPGGISTYHSA